MFLIVRVARGSFVPNALLVWLSYIAIFRYVRVWESYNARATDSLPMQDARLTLFLRTNTSHISCTHLKRAWNGERKWKVRRKHVSRNCLYTTFIFSPLILNLRHAQGDCKDDAPLQADCESKIAGCNQEIMFMPKLFCGLLRVVCGVKTSHVPLACALQFGQFLPVYSTYNWM
jgi:hypothetical protein